MILKEETLLLMVLQKIISYKGRVTLLANVGLANCKKLLKG